jgi:ubiquinol-cytochrome c reductase iron-sulfur subunit
MNARGGWWLRHNVRLVTALLLTSAAFAVGSFIAGFTSRRAQWQGALLAGALLCAGLALVVWANRVVGGGPFEEERETLDPSAVESAAMDEDLERGEELSRRVWVRRSAIAAGGAIALGFVEPWRTLGPTPGRAPLETSWRSGVRVVTPDGQTVEARGVSLDALLTIFPEGHTDEANAQVVLMRVPPDLLTRHPERKSWSPNGLLGFSKVCTHAGCPVGLYQSTIHQLLCPCHQSSFDVLDAARPISGPAAWPLPQLPLMIDAEGLLRANGELSAPVGPGWWKQ